MSRKVAREAAMQALFQLDYVRGIPKEEDILLALDMVFSLNENLDETDHAYVEGVVRGVGEHIKDLDEKISSFAKNWKIHRMAVVDRNILRLATYEMYYREDVSVGVAINEAVELSKRYGAENASRFVNGVLGAMTQSNS